MRCPVAFPTFLTFLAACGAAAASGALFPADAWYRGLNKPDWTPKAWAFAVIWALLYLLIAAAAARVAGLADARVGPALGFWAVQIALNTLWTPVVFGAHRIRAGLAVIGLLWLAVAATMLAFLGLDLLAGLMLVPYLIWVSIAAALNYRLWRLNPGA